MNRSTLFTAICLVSGLFLTGAASAQTANPSTGPSVETTKPAAAPVVKKDKNQKENPNATVNGSAPGQTVPTPAAAPVKAKKSRHVNPADIKPVDLSKMETAKPGETPDAPKATHIPFGKDKPVAGQKTVESAPLKKPADLKLAEPKN